LYNIHIHWYPYLSFLALISSYFRVARYIHYDTYRYLYLILLYFIPYWLLVILSLSVLPRITLYGSRLYISGTVFFLEFGIWNLEEDISYHICYVWISILFYSRRTSCFWRRVYCSKLVNLAALTRNRFGVLMPTEFDRVKSRRCWQWQWQRRASLIQTSSFQAQASLAWWCFSEP
jgi:hypothetical protein